MATIKTSVLKNSSLKQHEFNVTFKKDIESEEESTGFIKMNDPSFDIVVEAYGLLRGADGTLSDTVRPGKFILDACAYEIDADLYNNVQALINICEQLTFKFAMPILAQLEEKKSDTV